MYRSELYKRGGVLPQPHYLKRGGGGNYALPCPLAPPPPPHSLPFPLPLHCYSRAHIVCLTETWLDKVVGNQEVCLDASALSIEREIDMAKVWQWQFTILYTVSWLKALTIILYHCHVPVQVTSFFIIIGIFIDHHHLLFTLPYH